MNTFITTYTGGRFELLAPTADMVCIEDIAHSLAGLNRFTGHGSKHYSVAEHSIAVARRVRELGGSPIAILQALLHDAQEAYTGDVSSPAKQAMRELGDTWRSPYDALEERVWSWAIVPAFALPLELDPLIKQADKELCDIEGWTLLPNWGREPALGPEYAPQCLPAPIAEELFASAFTVAREGVEWAA